MVVRLRLARHGSKNNPFYHLVAIRDSAPRDARPIEKLGEYDPIPRPATAHKPAGVKHAAAQRSQSGLFTSGTQSQLPQKLEKRLEWNSERIQHWLSVGAQPSKPVARLLDRAGLLPPGTTYPGVWRPSPNAVGSSSTPPTASPSAILRAAGVTGETIPGSAQAAESSGTAEQTDPTVEARKVEAGVATPSQAQ